MARVFIGVGANIDPEENVSEALRMLSREADVVAVSTFYRTKPEERPEQPDFINGVVEIRTDKSPQELKLILRNIEGQLGRVRTDDKFAPRTIDLDVIIYDQLNVNNNDLVIPDPQITRRAFLAVPLFELRPDLVLPGTNVGISEIASGFTGHDMEPLHEYTEALRKDLIDEHRKS
jgi:2-amino-4-hydroxy-6-hydroxymethyldihydropteridine diphosphokinase